MRKFRPCAFLAAMVLLVFAVAGCGGGSLDPQSTTDPTGPTIPNDSPDTYDTQRILEGSWRALNESYTFSNKHFSFRMNSALLTFASTDIKGTVAQSKVTSHQQWYTNYESGDTSINLGLQTLGLDFSGQTGTMIHQGTDKWRCNIDGDTNAVMNITVSSDTVIQVNYQGVTPAMYNGIGAVYDFTLAFRKEDYTR